MVYVQWLLQSASSIHLFLSGYGLEQMVSSCSAMMHCAGHPAQLYIAVNRQRSIKVHMLYTLAADQHDTWIVAPDHSGFENE